MKVSCSKNSNEQSHRLSDKSKSKSDESVLPTLYNKHTVHLSDHRLNLTEHKSIHEELVVNMNENNDEKKGMKKRKSKINEECSFG